MKSTSGEVLVVELLKLHLFFLGHPVLFESLDCNKRRCGIYSYHPVLGFIQFANCRLNRLNLTDRDVEKRPRDKDLLKADILVVRVPFFLVHRTQILVTHSITRLHINRAP